MVPFALDACSLMAASLSSTQPADPRKQTLNSASLDLPVNSLMMSLALLKDGFDEERALAASGKHHVFCPTRLWRGIDLDRGVAALSLQPIGGEREGPVNAAASSGQAVG